MKDSSSTNKITLWFIVGFLVVVTVGLIVLAVISPPGASTTGSGFVATTAPPITAADWSEGNPNATVSLIEYGDFECPACGEYEPIVQQIVQNYSSTIHFVFRNFPLYTIHPDAGIAAQAAEAAGLQGKYWQMHDLLYQDQGTWSLAQPGVVVSQYFDGYAQSLGLDVNKFNTDINGTQVMTKINTDVDGGNAAAIDHTPTFFVNLTQIPNPTSYQDFVNTMNTALGITSTSTVTTSAPATITTTSTPAK